MDLVRDLLDKTVIDRDGRELGRVDSIVLDLGPTDATIVALELGPVVLARRIGGFAARVAAAVEHLIGLGGRAPLRVPFSRVMEIGDHVRVDVRFADTPAAIIEDRLRGWLGSLPEAGRK